jgi:peptide/nickel transport system permease protein
MTAALLIVPYTTRMVRANVRDVAPRSFVRSAVLRGVPRRRVTWRHIAPNASAPAVSVVALNAADLIGGLVVIETVFGFPGIGQALVEAVIGKDIPTVQTIVLLIGTGFVVLNLLADLVLLALNPKLRRA